MDEQRSDIRAPLERETVSSGSGSATGLVEPDIARPIETPRVSLDEPQRVRRRPARILLWLVLLAVFGGAAVLIVPRLGHQPSRTRFVPPTPVGVATTQKGEMPVTLSGLGTVTPLATVTVQTQISGQLIKVGFHEGQLVKAGDFLAQIDPRPYQVALENAQAQLGKDQAALNDARVDLKRYNTLVAQNSIATQTRDTQAALVLQDAATIKADQAQIDVQKLNLVYCHIVSPVTGRVGLRQVDAGNYVTPTSLTNGIVIVTQLQPISVIFTLPEDDLPEFLQRFHAGASLPVTAFDRTGTTKLAEGRLETVDNQIDTTTGTVKFRAIFANPDEMLFPNQFVNVKLLVDTLQNVDIVPSSAIQRGAPGTFVYRVEPDHTVTVQKVKLGPSDGQRVAVLSGLEPGDSVVDDGADRLKDGAKVTLASSAGVSGRAAGQPNSRTLAAGRRQTWKHRGAHWHMQHTQ
jgi:membrane fusion protein, multidrug efflux system